LQASLRRLTARTEPEVEGESTFETELIDRLDWLIRLRWWAVGGTAAALAVGWYLYGDQLAVVPLGAVILAIALYNAQLLLYARTLKLDQAGTAQSNRAAWQSRAGRFACIQIVLDLIALAALLHFSGGAENPMGFFFVFHTIIASILLTRRVSFLVATLAAALYGALAAAEYSGLLPHYHLPALDGLEVVQEGDYLLLVVVVMALTLWLAAYMTSSISARLRTRDRQLVASHRDILGKGRELQAVNQRLRRIDAERTRFLTLVTHELRAPVNTIHTCVELALSGYASPEKQREILERVQIRTAELSDLISDLLRLARAREEAGRDEDIGPVVVADVLQAVVPLMRTEAEKKDLFLSVDLDAGLAPVRANPERLKLVWTNLLSNAIKYTEPGGIVAVTLKEMPEHLICTVRDTGIGIPAEDRDRIFEEFYRAENARSLSPVGTGVGLAIVRRIVENWEGEITVESELGLGSKFTFTLRRADTG
jgi:signal transduction histidine kinase